MGGRVGTCPVRGPLAPWAAGFEAWLVARGFSSRTVGHRMCLLAVLSRWLEREGLTAGDLSEERAEMFVAARRGLGYVTWVSSRCVALPLAYLREVGSVPPPVAVVVEGPLAGLLEDYREYLVCERGLAPSTIASYERGARLFLEQRPDGLELDRLTAADVSGFLARECRRLSVAGARHLGADLRPLLRYLHVAGLISSPLVWAVPGVADLRDRSLPRGLDPAVVARLLASCDRRRTVGRRDYAILLLLVRLGLRAGEVAAMQLEDLDWRAGEVLIRGKRDRLDTLPLPVDVGEALVCYPRRRRASKCRAVFLTVNAPIKALSRVTVCGVVRSACVRAGVAPVGAHRYAEARVMPSLPSAARLLHA
jgi:integrase/recombinase XerD